MHLHQANGVESETPLQFSTTPLSSPRACQTLAWPTLYLTNHRNIAQHCCSSKLSIRRRDMELTSKADQLTRWFAENGGHLNEAVELVHNLEYGYHYMALNGPIGSQELVCECPFSLTLSHLNVVPKSPAGIRNYSLRSVCSMLMHNPKIHKSTIAAFFLAEQRLKSKESFWFPYIQLLPSEADMTTPLWFTEEELLYLKGTNLLSNGTPLDQTSLGSQRRLLRDQWELGVSGLSAAGESTGNFTW